MYLGMYLGCIWNALAVYVGRFGCVFVRFLNVFGTYSGQV
jgi:hypothetical protein